MNCIKCKHFAIKFNASDIKNCEYCKKFGCYIKTLKEKIKKTDCCEEGENWITEWSKEAAYQYGVPEHWKNL